MPIIRGHKPTEFFYVLNKNISEDKRLTWEARGLLIYLLGKPDDWQISVSQLIAETRSARKTTGRDGIYAILKELMACGYVSRSLKQAEKGKLDGYDYYVTEGNVSPFTASPYTAPPFTANPTLISTVVKQEKKKKPKGAEQARLLDVPDWVPKKALADFLANRKALKAPVTDRALTMLLNKLKALHDDGVDIEECLNESVINGWKSVFPSKSHKPKQQADDAYSLGTI